MLKDINKTAAKRVLGIDCSTHSLAFCIYENRRPVRWGKINFEGASVFERIRDAKLKTAELAHTFDVDYIAMESAILAKVQNADVTIKLAMVYGTVLGELLVSNSHVVTVKPLEWQSDIGNNNWTAAQKAALKKEFPGKSAGWYSGRIREERKKFTMNYFNSRWDMRLDDDDVSDSCGIARFAYRRLTKR